MNQILFQYFNSMDFLKRLFNYLMFVHFVMFLMFIIIGDSSNNDQTLFIEVTLKTRPRQCILKM